MVVTPPDVKRLPIQRQGGVAFDEALHLREAFDHEGNETFWTVTGDNVSALAICDINDDGQAKLFMYSWSVQISTCGMLW
eukprot:2845836-Amphidinium_carterae.1